ncbi:MAG: site-specific integrase [Proteobacteria bacterium]|nr:site-specific integrase [Pseudomonadota bacterium]
MAKSNKSVSPLRQRMIDDLTLRKLNEKTQVQYIRAVVRLTRYLGRSPDTATAEDLRLFQLHMAETGVSNITINTTLTGLKFFFTHTTDTPEVLKRVQRVYEPRKLPAVLTAQEVTRLLDAAGSLRNKAALSISYGSGLRASEVCHLKISDIDSERMILQVEEGKGQRDRYAMLSPTMLNILRAWYRDGLAKRKLLPGGWLFPGQQPVNPISTRQLNRIFHLACVDAGIDKTVCLHSLRHSFATHLLEQHVDIRVIQVLLGHKRIANTMRYSHVATNLLKEVKGPLEYLNL